MYAIIQTGGKQYKVSEGDVIRVERLEQAVGDTVTFDEVLMVSGEKTSVGTPFVKGASVSATVTAAGKDQKVIVYKYKRKSGYHRKNGHRQYYTEVRIDSVTE